MDGVAGQVNPVAAECAHACRSFLAAAPHALVLRLRLAHVSPAGSPLWGEITARVPQLRALTLELEPDVLLSFELGFYGWPDGILVSTLHHVTALF